MHLLDVDFITEKIRGKCVHELWQAGCRSLMIASQDLRSISPGTESAPEPHLEKQQQRLEMRPIPC
jgi:hypothetical protein